MPLPFDFEGKGVLDLELLVKNKDFIITDSNQAVSSYFVKNNCFFNSNSFGEPTSVLDSRISGGPTSSSTLSSSRGGGGGAVSTDTAGAGSTTATSSNAGGADSELLPVTGTAAGGGGGGNTDKCAMEDWENVLSDSGAVSPSQEQSIFRWIMGDVEDPAIGNLNKALQIGGGSAAPEFDFSGGFGVVDQGIAGDQFVSNLMSSIYSNNRSSAEKADLGSNPIYSAFDSSLELKPPIFNPQLLINQHQAQHTQNPSFFLPFSYAQLQEQSVFVPPPAKKPNYGGPISGGLEARGPIPNGSYLDTRQQEMLIGRQQLHQAFPHYLQQRPIGPKTGGGDELGHIHQQQQTIIDQLYNVAELVQTGNLVLAQGILARLNQQLSPIGKPFHRAAFYCKEALQLLLHTNNNNDVNPSTAFSSPFSLIFKIGAYKSFSEISPLVEFTNFTCNQALLEVFEGFDQIHIVDFDIGYGGQWASLMQELALRSGGAPLLKITAVASQSTHDQLELSLTRENLIQFASEINIEFEFEVMGIDSLNSNSWSFPFRVSENEAVAVNLPIGCLANYQLSVAFVLRFVKQMSPRIVVSVDRGCDRTDLPFANHVIHALQSYSNLLESLDAVNVNLDALQKIERFLLQPGIEKIVMGRYRSPEKSQHWRSLFLSSGFSPVTFSNFTESQAECVVKRTPVQGFQVEKRQSSLVLCWQRKELVSASVWRC
ncbi:hypothetical protein DH2020_044616 [Rehmannia glutinosa]|uniref:Scarecrow-like protein n=1 Tax=Rehmannia glutinosa TaxID=99300 RepID=A0ABR0UGF1_REHGL